MDPDSWGPRMWKVLHMYAVEYPAHPTALSKTQAKTWYHNMISKLPCGECARKYEALIECAMPLTSNDLASRKALFEWTVKLHNMVNILLHKPVFDLKDARRLYF